MRQLLSLLTILLLSVSCVGTVQNADQVYSKINEPGEEILDFDGITMAEAISDSRIEVFFYPAGGGSGKFTYDILLANSPTPISIPSEVLKPDYRGLLKHTITGLQRLSSYNIKVQVRDRVVSAQSNTERSITVKTFDNRVADFNGISTASNMPGQDGKDSIKVRWTPARSSGSGLDWDPKAYEVVVVDAERLTPADMDQDGLTPADGRWVFGFNHNPSVNEYVVRGLLPKTRYYIRMRAIHEKSENDIYNPRKRSELNTNYVDISTLSADLTDILFEGDAFSVSLAEGSQGLNALETTWKAAAGVFDHYRLYYAQALDKDDLSLDDFPDVCLPPLLADPSETVFCKKANFDQTSSPITGLTPYTNYKVVLVLCATNRCGPGEYLRSPVRNIRTDPSIPNFTGLRDYQIAQTLEDLGKVRLFYEIPNFTQGYFDGLVIKMRITDDGSDVPKEITSEPYDDVKVYHHEYNFLTQSSVTLEGIDYLADHPYCFTMHPFKYTSGTDKEEFPNDVWRCMSPRPEAPTADQFPGFDGGYSENGLITLSWQPPAAGIFSHYEVFWKKQPDSTFIWGEAVNEAGNNYDYTNYGRERLESDKTSINLSGFVDGTYSFGVLTYYTYVTEEGPVTLRSETNPNVLRCTVDSLSPDSIQCQ